MTIPQNTQTVFTQKPVQRAVLFQPKTLYQAANFNSVPVVINQPQAFVGQNVAPALVTPANMVNIAYPLANVPQQWTSNGVPMFNVPVQQLAEVEGCLSKVVT